MINKQQIIYALLLLLPMCGTAQNTWTLKQVATTYNGVWMASATEGWAVGGTSSILRTTNNWTTSELQVSGLGSQIVLSAVWGTSNTNVWVVGASSTALNYNGSAWAARATGLPSGLTINAVWGTDANNVFLAAANGTAGVVYQFNGTQWNQVGADMPSFTPNAIWGSSASDLWAAGSAGQIYRYTGVAWASATVPSPPTSFQGIWGTDANNIWAVGRKASGAIYYWDGTTWTAQTTSLPNVTITINSVWGTDANNIWAVTGSGSGSTYVLRYQSGAWSTVPSTSAAGELKSIAGVNNTTMTIVGGTTSLVYTFDGALATLKNNASTFVGDMWAVDANNVWAIGNPTQILKYNGTSWVVQPSNTTATISAIWGTDVNNIWAGGASTSGNATIIKYNGTTWTSKSPSPAISATISSIWGSSATDIWAVGSKILHTTDGGATWTTVATPPMPLTSISGVDANNIWASGNTNSPSISSVILKYDGTSWTQQFTVNDIYINGIYAADANRIWAAGTFGSIYQSTNGGTSWSSPSPLPGGAAYYGIYGKDRFNVWAYGTKITKWNGSTWSAYQSTDPITTTNFFGMTSFEATVPAQQGSFLPTATHLFLTGQNGVVMLSTDNQVVLPVELLSFLGRNTEGGNLLTWTTASAINNKGFEVQRSPQPPKGASLTWETIGFINAKGKAATYEFTDKAPFGGWGLYRLRQIDNDGKETFSKVISIENTPSGGRGLNVYPNPAHNSLMIDYAVYNPSKSTTYTVVNLLGQVLLQGNLTPQLDISTLPVGSFILKIGEAKARFVKQ